MTDGMQIKSKEVTIATPGSGTTVQATGFLNLPGRKFLALMLKITSAIPASRHVTKVGTGGDDDLFATFGDNTSLGANGHTQTLTERVFYQMGSTGNQNLQLTFNDAPGGTSGAIRATVFYLEGLHG